MLVPILDEVIGEAAEAGHPAHPDRHGAPRPAERAGARAEQAVRADPRRVQGSGVVAQLPRGHGVDRRREVPRRRAPRDHGRRASCDLVVSMPPNPSHLEAVDPVVEGMARAAGTTRRRRRAAVRSGAQRADPDPRRRRVPRPGHRRRDAEPEPAARLRHRRHDPHHRQQPARVHDRLREDSYSTSYASGLARGFKIPIVHVNADDPEACVEAARLAFAYRATFQRDFLIDLIGYRRYGPQRGGRAGVHAAADVPEDRGAPDGARDLGAARWSSAASIDRGRLDGRSAQDVPGRAAGRRSTTLRAGAGLRRAAARGAAARRGRAASQTAVPLERLRELNAALLTSARRLHGPPQARAACARSAAQVLDAPDERTVDWATRRGAGASRRSSPTASASA